MVNLSTTDLGLFFDPVHHALAHELGTYTESLTQLPENSRKVAEAMGQAIAIYRWLVPAGWAGSEPSAEQSRVSVRALCLIREWLGFYHPLADSIFAVQGLGTYPLIVAGTSEQKAEIVPKIIQGTAIAAFALTEPEAGSDVAAMQTTATSTKDGYRLVGKKTLISNVGIADHYLVFAKTQPELKSKGVSAFLVPKNTPGLQEQAIPLSMDHPLGSLTFEDCLLPRSALVGQEGQGFKIAMQTLDTFRVSVGAAALGMAQRAISETLKHVRSRVQFGKALAEQPVVQSMIADMVTKYDAARLLVWRAAYLKDTSSGRCSKEVAMAKLVATEHAQQIIDTAVQLHGGLGVTHACVVEKLYREIRPLRIYEGTSEIQRLIIGSTVVREM
jgi:acyl-CoA dehydrogenase